MGESTNKLSRWQKHAVPDRWAWSQSKLHAPEWKIVSCEQRSIHAMRVPVQGRQHRLLELHRLLRDISYISIFTGSSRARPSSQNGRAWNAVRPRGLCRCTLIDYSTVHLVGCQWLALCHPLCSKVPSDRKACPTLQRTETSMEGAAEVIWAVLR
mmetsp:Transcript_28852/g.69755  ORF Transcript_28852/g.69755 Transcript_28852/m.69755 type:complete len:155 (+) Transcript_28852:530-994(+)